MLPKPDSLVTRMSLLPPLRCCSTSLHQCLHHKVLFPFRFSAASTFCQVFRESTPEPLVWKGDHLITASVESWCLSRTSSGQPWSQPTPRLSLTSLLVLHQPLHTFTSHPTMVCGGVGGSLGLVSLMFVGPTCQQGCQQPPFKMEERRERCDSSPSEHWQCFPSPSGCCSTQDVWNLTAPGNYSSVKCGWGEAVGSKAARTLLADRYCGALQ